MEYFANHKSSLWAYLRTINGLIHFAFNLWTAPNIKAINGIVSHFLDQNPAFERPRTSLLALSPMYDSHEGVNIAKNVIQTIRDYKITEKIGYFVLDNAGNNDTAIAEVARRLGKGEKWARWRRLRCLGHIINLIARALFFDERKDIWEAQSQMQKSSEEEIELWRKLGPIGKLHNFIKWVRRSPQRNERFLVIVEQNRKKNQWTPYRLNLVQNNNTRWNSTHDMIKRAIILRAEIGQFIEAEVGRYHYKLRAGRRDGPKTRIIFPYHLRE